MENNIVEDLKDTFQNVNNWLNFAEIKHGALIVLDTTFIMGIIAAMFENKVKCLGIIGLDVMIISVLLSMYSYFPNIKGIKDEWMFCEKRMTQNRNLLFYRDIYRLSNKEYLQEVYKEYYSKDIEEFSKKELDYAEEIVVNSRITMKKYFLFKISLIVSCIGIILLAMSVFSV